MNIEPRVRFQGQVLCPTKCTWSDFGGEAITIQDALYNVSLDFTGNIDARIIKQTTTFEVVEEMEPTK